MVLIEFILIDAKEVVQALIRECDWPIHPFILDIKALGSLFYFVDNDYY